MPDLQTNETLPLADSPRLAALIQQLSENASASEDFWQTLKAEGTPIIEALPNQPDHCIVTFLWRGDADTQQVLLIVDTLTDLYRRSDLAPCFMQSIANTDIWYLSYQLQADLRATYHFHPVSKQQSDLSTGPKDRDEWLAILNNTQPDPFNAETFPSRRGSKVLSVLALPQARPDPWWRSQPDTPSGMLTVQRFESALLHNTRDIWAYLPADYAPENGPYPLLLMLDGQAWTALGSIQNTLDNLIAAGEIPPMIALGIDSLDPETRAEELTCNPQFVRFLTEELLLWAGEQWAISTDPAQTLIAGQSYGGLAAAFAGFTASSRIGNVIAQSGSFWWRDDEPTQPQHEWLTGQLAQAEKHPLRFYVSVGWQEWMLVETSRHLRDVLTAKGYPLIYDEYNGGHDYICWRGGIAEALIALTQSWNTAEHVPDAPIAIREVTVTPRSTIPPQKPKFPTPEIAESPRIQALQAALHAGDAEALAVFWQQAEAEGTPLVEALPDDPQQMIVTFLWRGDDSLVDVVILANKFTDSSVFEESLMLHLPQSDVWYRSYRMRSDWRASYKLAPITSTADPALGDYVARLAKRAVSVGSSVPQAILERWWSAVEKGVPDPLNLQRFNGHSVVALPDAPSQSWADPREDIPAGQVTQHRLTSGILGNERRVWVYTPAHYTTEGQPYGVLVMLDGQSWVHEHPIMPTLDNLIAAGMLPPLVVILPESLGFETRVKEMAGHRPFIDFLAQELMPWAMSQWHITDAPEETLIAGQSLGGLTAAFAGLAAPERFGNVLTQSGSFWWANGAAFGVDSEWIAQEYARLPRRPVRFYVDVGLQEWVLIGPTRHLYNVLSAKGYTVTYNEFNGGHDDACFRGSIADGLMALTRPWSEG